MKTAGYILVAAVLALAPLGLLVYNLNPGRKNQEPAYVTVEFASSQPKEMAPGVEFGVLSCKIIDGHVFKILLENQQWIEGRLRTATKDEATAAVVDVVRASNAPSVTLLRNFNGYWVVEFHLTVGGKRTTLHEWLQEKKLTL
jgi:hypothetical protein